MLKFPVALQLYSVRDDMEADFKGTLQKVKELGYDGVEFAGLYGHSPAEVKAMCEEIGLVPISAHVPYVDMANNLELINDYKEIGCKYVVVPYLTTEYLAGQPKYDEFRVNVEKFMDRAEEIGVKICYHNHDFEFGKVGEDYILDIFYRDMPRLSPEFDVCWVNVGGESPVEYIHKYEGRQEILHLKDFVGQKTENMYGLIGLDEGEKKSDVSKFEFRPVGYGVQDFPAILKAAEEVNMKWVVVEQDQPSMEKTPMECAELSINYLKAL